MKVNEINGKCPPRVNFVCKSDARGAINDTIMYRFGEKIN